MDIGNALIFGALGEIKEEISSVSQLEAISCNFLCFPSALGGRSEETHLFHI
jgi:hypothetical protein